MGGCGAPRPPHATRRPVRRALSTLLKERYSQTSVHRQGKFSPAPSFRDGRSRSRRGRRASRPPTTPAGTARARVLGRFTVKLIPYPMTPRLGVAGRAVAVGWISAAHPPNPAPRPTDGWMRRTPAPQATRRPARRALSTLLKERYSQTSFHRQGKFSPTPSLGDDRSRSRRGAGVPPADHPGRNGARTGPWAVYS
jgi:hypothetical protein